MYITIRGVLHKVPDCQMFQDDEEELSKYNYIIKTLEELAMSHITADDVIQKKQQQLVNENADLQDEKIKLQMRLQEVELRIAEVQIEYHIFEEHSNRGEIFSTQQPLLGEQKRHRGNDKLLLEDAIKKIFDAAGKPIKIGQIIERLEDFGYQWSSYHGAYQYISKTTVITRVPQAKGFYQLMR